MLNATRQRPSSIVKAIACSGPPMDLRTTTSPPHAPMTAMHGVQARAQAHKGQGASPGKRNGTIGPAAGDVLLETHGTEVQHSTPQTAVRRPHLHDVLHARGLHDISKARALVNAHAIGLGHVQL